MDRAKIHKKILVLKEKTITGEKFGLEKSLDTIC